MVELIGSFEARAAVHAALADPVRLAIVDLLALGDRSPTELQAALGVTSNLLSHHLKVLEERGIVARERSQGDQRRSYVRLIPGSLEAIAAPVAASARRVLFVCTANSARSQLAAALWGRNSGIPAASAGTHPAERIAAGARRAAERHSLDLPDSAPRSIDEVAHDGDFVITVCDSAHEELRIADALHWSIPDPVAVGTDDAFDRAFEEISQRIGILAPCLSHGERNNHV